MKTCHAISIVNGTAALHAALVGAGVAAGDEVLIPSLTFVATAVEWTARRRRALSLYLYLYSLTVRALCTTIRALLCSLPFPGSSAVERRTVNPLVVGSIPTRGAIRLSQPFPPRFTVARNSRKSLISLCQGVS